VPSGNTGKIIQQVSVSKKEIKLTFLDGDTLDLPYDVYVEGYYYVGKVVDPQTLANLKEQAALQPLMTYGFRLLSRGKYSEYQVREKLYLRDAKKPQVDAVIARLKQAHLLDDARLMGEWVSYYRQRHYGPAYIEEKLYQKGLNASLIASLSSDDQQDQDAIQWLLPPLFKKYQQRSFQEQRSMIKQRLVQRGFRHATIQKVFATLASVSIETELTSLQVMYAKVKSRLSRRYQGTALQEKIINFLLRKGYNYANIRRVIKESKDVD
jgi:SOS response regulatory protein OraA/RecX